MRLEPLACLLTPSFLPAYRIVSTDEARLEVLCKF